MLGKTDTKNIAIFGIVIVCLAFSAWMLRSSVITMGNIDTTRNELSKLIDTSEKLENERNLLEDECNRYADNIAEYKYLEEEKNRKRDTFYEDILKLEQKILDGETEAKIAYLTIDDGPNMETTECWVKTFSDYDVLATFFVNKKDNLENEYRLMKDNHHTICNHTASHLYSKIYSSPYVFMKDISENHDFIRNTFGYEMSIARFPGGSGKVKREGRNLPEFTYALKNNSYGYVDWNVSSGDGLRNQAPECYAKNVLEGVEGIDIAVILMHDDSIGTLTALPEIIEGLEEKGYILLPMQYQSVCIKK